MRRRASASLLAFCGPARPLSPYAPLPIHRGNGTRDGRGPRRPKETLMIVRARLAAGLAALALLVVVTESPAKSAGRAGPVGRPSGARLAAPSASRFVHGPTRTFVAS